ncbi:hypothetical protein Ahy_A03g015534 isoform B [Arachis hypogaea]|uniref:Uncharacterized protein n=1 Tax=Arachis hypogaea TaxID=3818 RepID=A0A445E0V7_ARAHY|nr:hypothetical protein Ahy_A03g015534 isoform B [Arachis hypogaea]
MEERKMRRNNFALPSVILAESKFASGPYPWTHYDISCKKLNKHIGRGSEKLESDIVIFYEVAKIFNSKMLAKQLMIFHVCKSLLYLNVTRVSTGQ